ncbi:endogenous retrovirus group K, member 6 [Gossypium australe]|uniref:Endogenous retrovirus group K, member 6 n=1 Tax=Gossypium australe TaxID=47621 RepID=A0A5B6VML7_9ROSI|nr:endogenous retrovirus group K, member 6 [Gossypium australe]
MEEIYKDKRQSDMKSRDFSKRGPSKLFQTSTSKKFHNGFIGRDRPGQSNLRFVNSPVASVGTVRNVEKPICEHYGTCFKCGCTDHFHKNCPKQFNDSGNQNTKLETTSQRGRKLGNGRGGTTGRGKAWLEARAPSRAYAIRAREEASAPDIITSTFSLFYINVFELIDLR